MDTRTEDFSRHHKCLLSLLIFFLFFPSGNGYTQTPGASQEFTSNEVFLKAFYPLDEPRFHCVDIPGHRSRVNTAAFLVVHTCKEGIWNQDELFDSSAISKGQLRMPEYDLCVSANSPTNGARLMLAKCDNSELQFWKYTNYRLRLKHYPEKCLAIGPESSQLTRGGRRNITRNRSRSLMLLTCSEEAFERQLWRMEPPLKRSTPILPMK